MPSTTSTTATPAAQSDTTAPGTTTGTGAAVFRDSSGRRWRRTKVVSGLGLLVLVVIAALLIPPAWSLARAQPAGLDVSVTKVQTGAKAPVIGAGPLMRVVRVASTPRGLTAVEPFTGAELGALTPAQARHVAAAPYAIQRYGYGPNAARTISLSFDDGPDPKVTPRLLDVLKANKIHATFFVVGRYVSQHPELIERMRREGHAIGVHTVSHPNIAQVPDWIERGELNLSERLIRQTAGVGASYWRMPYDGLDESFAQEGIDGILRAQQLGYTFAAYDWDTQDWLHAENANGTWRDIPLPDLSKGKPLTILLHDAGGPNRMRTVDYVSHLIGYATAHGYTFTTMPQVVPELAGGNPTVAPGLGDQLAMWAVQARYDWPDSLVLVLFWLAVFFVVVVGVTYVTLAVRRYRRRRAMTWPAAAEIGIGVSVVLAAYNEEPVIARTLRTLLDSDYPISEIVVVDDGSADGTAAQVMSVAATDPRVRLIRQANTGKAGALNHGLQVATGEVIVTVDADTILATDAITNLVRHFALDHDRRLGAVAGVVRVGNQGSNLLTRWQSLEYLTQIGLERSAQDAVGAISIIPGACAAWRKEAILDAGGYSTATLAEDCDLALTLHERGWRVTQDDEAYAYTEAPECVDDLLAQRTRWTFGTLQAVAKHRRILGNRRFGWLGLWVLPSYLISVVMPLMFTPFVTWIALTTLQVEGPWLVLKFFLIFLGLHLITAGISVKLMGESLWMLLAVPIYRIVFEPLRAYLLYTSAWTALKGSRMGWNKLARTGSMDAGSLAAVTTRPGKATA